MGARTVQTVFEVVDPATGERIGSVADATPADGLRALDAAHAAQAAWAATTPDDRANLLRAIYDGIMASKEEFAASIVAEMGKPWGEALGEVAYGAGFFRWFAESANRLHLEG